MNLLIDFILFIIFAVPFSVLVHEMGHAIAARLFKAENIMVSIGSGKEIGLLRLVQIEVVFHMNLIIGGYTSWHGRAGMKSWKYAGISLGGPVASGCAAFLLFFFLGPFTPAVIEWTMLFNFWLLIVNLIPFRIGSRESDGFMMLAALFSKRHEDS